MKRLCTILAFVLTLTACELKVQEIPAPNDLIPKNKMALILEELMVTEQYVQLKHPQPNDYQEVAKNSGEAILKKHGVHFRRFDSSMDYYASHQDEMKQIYNQVLENINKKLNKL